MNPTLSPRNLHDAPTRSAAMHPVEIYFKSLLSGTRVNLIL